MKIKNPQKLKKFRWERRRRRVRARVFGTAERPRLSVFRSAKHINAQLIDDVAGRTLAAASDVDLKKKEAGKTSAAAAVGTLLGERALEKGIKKVVFDRGGSTYHGRIKALADGARAAGLQF